MTLAADAASQYHEAVGSPVESLRASMAAYTASSWFCMVAETPVTFKPTE